MQQLRNHADESPGEGKRGQDLQSLMNLPIAMTVFSTSRPSSSSSSSPPFRTLAALATSSFRAFAALSPLAYIAWYLGVLGYGHVNGVGSSWGSDVLYVEATCCSGLHVGTGFAGWLLWPVYALSIYWQVRDLTGSNEAVSHHGAEPLRQTLGDMLEYTVGVALCVIAARVEPLRIPGDLSWSGFRDEALPKFKNLIWAGFEVPDESLTDVRLFLRRRSRQNHDSSIVPTSLARKCLTSIYMRHLINVMHLLVLVLFLFYVSVSLQDLPSDSPLQQRVVISCCSSTHVLLGFFVWYFPPLSVVFAAIHIAQGAQYLNNEATPDLGVLAEYVLGVAICCVANRALPLLTNFRIKDQCWRMRMLFHLGVKGE